MASPTRDRMVTAALDLLRQSGLSGAGINSVVEASGAPKGSVYHHFPAGKNELVTAALHEAETLVGTRLRRLFASGKTLEDKVRTLFATTAEAMAGTDFTRGCPVAAVTLDLEHDADGVRRVCAAILDAWRDAIADGLPEVPVKQRPAVAQLVLATLEGAMILSRAHATTDALRRSGEGLAAALTALFPSPTPRPRRRRGR